MDLIWWIGGLSILGVMLLYSGYAPILRARKASSLSEAIGNARQVGISLYEFEADYGSFPSATTIPDVKARTSTSLTLDDSSSNKLFRQLIAHGLTREKPFYAKAPGCKKPDDLFNSDAAALSKGECAFSYVVGLKSSYNSRLPIVMTPMASGTQSFYRTKPFEERAIVLHLDNSVTVFEIRGDGIVERISGDTLFDPSVWGSVKPDLRWPE